MLISIFWKKKQFKEKEDTHYNILSSTESNKEVKDITTQHKKDYSLKYPSPQGYKKV